MGRRLRIVSQVMTSWWHWGHWRPRHSILTIIIWKLFLFNLFLAIVTTMTTTLDNKSDDKAIIETIDSSKVSQEFISNPNEPTINVPLNEISSSPKSRSDSMSSTFLDWFANNEFISKVAEKAKNSMDTMITTLDPGMKQIICKYISITFDLIEK